MRTMIAVFIAAALALSGCGGPEAPPPEVPVSPASPASQETLSESPASQLDPEPAPDPDDALAQEIILAYGGEEIHVSGGPFVIRVEGEGLELRAMTVLELLITGRITGIQLS